MNFRTYEDLSVIISNNLHKIPEDIDLIVGIPRSGLMAASMISLHLNLPLTDIDSLLENKIYNHGRTKAKEKWLTDPSKAKKILIVDDSSVTGSSINEAKQKLEKSKFKDKAIYLVVFVTEETKDIPDIYFDICPKPRMFEWNYMHHMFLDRACVDIDGVLCQDPTPEENDDGEKYIKFISTVKPRIVPAKKIKYLVTTRLEKYRKYTEKWLKKNNIQFENLIMMDLPSKEERMKLGNHGQFKGEQYKNLPDAKIFIESNKNQAKVIANVSGKEVFCVDDCKFYKPEIQEPRPKIEEKKEEENPINKKTSLTRKAFRKIVPLEARKKLKRILKKK